MNVYDFDGTIYRGDSSIDFFVYCLKSNPLLILGLPRFFLSCICYRMGKISKKKLKETYFAFLCHVNDVEYYVQGFWNQHEYKVKDWYMRQKAENDVVITASPDFLISEICMRLGISTLIATNVDLKTGRFLSENCHGEEKVKRFHQLFPDCRPNQFYSDSLSDLPMARLAKQAFLVSGEECKPWELD